MIQKSQIVSITATGNQYERPGIVIESENGKHTIKLLTGQSGNATISEADLKKLYQIVGEAIDYLYPKVPVAPLNKVPVPGQIG